MSAAKNRPPVLLVHGIWDTNAIFDRMSAYLTQQGRSVYSLDLIPNNGDAGLDDLAEQVAKYARRCFGQEQPFDLVGYSMGGIVSRYYVQRLGGINRVQRFVTISSPHNGTVVAYGSWRVGCMQMRPDSLFLQDLNRDMALLGQIEFTSIWTPYDFMIVPAISSRLPVGREVIVPVGLHRWMVSDVRSLNAIAQALSVPLQRDRQFEQNRDSQKLPLGGSNI